MISRYKDMNKHTGLLQDKVSVGEQKLWAERSPTTDSAAAVPSGQAPRRGSRPLGLYSRAISSSSQGASAPTSSGGHQSDGSDEIIVITATVQKWRAVDCSNIFVAVPTKHAIDIQQQLQQQPQQHRRHKSLEGDHGASFRSSFMLFLDLASDVPFQSCATSVVCRYSSAGTTSRSRCAECNAESEKIGLQTWIVGSTPSRSNPLQRQPRALLHHMR